MAKCLIRILSELKHKYRSVAVVEEHPSPSSNLAGLFPEVPVTTSDRYYRKSFEYWVGGFQIKERFHGWNKSQHGGKYTDCFVFKNVSQAERVYGFLCRPKSDDNYEMCVLVLRAVKKKWKTDTAELKRAKELRSDVDIWAALKDPKLFTTGRGESK